MTLGLPKSTSLYTEALEAMERPVLLKGETNRIIGDNLLEESYEALRARSAYTGIEQHYLLAERIKRFLNRG